MVCSLRRSGLATKACCRRVSEDQSLPLIECHGCRAITCGLHAYIDVRGGWRCAACFRDIGWPSQPMALALAGQVPPPPHGVAHVVVVLHALRICGVARHCLELLACLNELQVHTSVIALQGGGQWADHFLQSANDVTVLSDPSSTGSELAAIPWRSRNRIVSAHYDPAISWAVGSPIPAKMFAHFHTEPEFGYFTRATLIAAGTRCAKIFFPSVTTRDAYRKLLQHKPDWWDRLCAVLPNAAPASMVRPRISCVPQTPSNDHNLAVVSRIDPDKISIPLLIDSLRLAKERLPTLQVRVAGSGLLAPELRQALDRSGINSFVQLLGWVDDVASVYMWSHATFLPSHSETMPYAVIESLQLGKPAAAPRLGYFSEHQSEHPLIFLFDPGDAASAAKAIVDAVTQPAPKSPHSTQDRLVELFDFRAWRRQIYTHFGIAEAEEHR